MRISSGTRGEGRGVRGIAFLFITLLTLLLSPLISPVWAESAGAQHFQTGLAYERLGRYDEAYTELQLGFALDPDNTENAVALGVVACRLGRITVAQRAFERSIAVDSNSIASYYHLAFIYEKNGTIDRALDAWHRFLSLNQDETLKIIAKKHIQNLEALTS
jgi:tetratricopeptide (TPR) repeat protein